MKTIPRMILALCLIAIGADAAIITQTKTIGEHTPSKTSNLDFNKFDTDLGTLESVQITFNLYMFGGSVSVDNDSEDNQTVTGYLKATGVLKLGGAHLKNETNDQPWRDIENVVSYVFELGPTVGGVDDPIDEYNKTEGVDWGRYDGPTEENARLISASDYINSSEFGSFQAEGGGTYTITAETDQVISIEGNAQFAGTVLQAYGDVTVTYNYTPIPEPATSSLAAAGLLLLIRRRRKA